MRASYLSALSQKQLAVIQLILERVRKVTKPRIIDLFAVFCTVVYILKTDCQWRALPGDHPKWETIYTYFSK
ncbi:transposase-like protein [Nitrosomonas eutropha C91]|uniref:Transposase-like protein n=1 Tax=Nitrosomonas eutropha (strain DSM 101675 / C91 / Nm57) TaxID=335283 RepID=Q0AFW5_NITEC|nr:transposase-like protein [Nitrosomonas eutropha C91]